MNSEDLQKENIDLVLSKAKVTTNLNNLQVESRSNRSKLQHERLNNLRALNAVLNLSKDRYDYFASLIMTNHYTFFDEWENLLYTFENKVRKTSINKNTSGSAINAPDSAPASLKNKSKSINTRLNITSTANASNSTPIAATCESESDDGILDPID